MGVKIIPTKKFRTFGRIFSFMKKHHYVKQEFNSDLTFSEQIQSGLKFLFEIFPFRKTYNTGRVIVLLNSLYTMRYVFIKMMQTFNWTVYTFKKVLLLSSTNNCNANVTFELKPLYYVLFFSTLFMATRHRIYGIFTGIQLVIQLLFLHQNDKTNKTYNPTWVSGRSSNI